MQRTESERHAAASFADASPNTDSGQRGPLATFLDRAIVILMVAILLTLSWPVSVVLWHQSRPAAPSAHQAAGYVP